MIQPPAMQVMTTHHNFLDRQAMLLRAREPLTPADRELLQVCTARMSAMLRQGGGGGNHIASSGSRRSTLLRLGRSSRAWSVECFVWMMLWHGFRTLLHC